MIPAVVLCAMALLDGALAGFRAVAGRDAHIVKEPLLRRGVRRGVGCGVGELVVIAVMLLALLLGSPDAERLFGEMVDAGRRMLVVFVPYTVIVLSALGAYAVPNLELRCLATVVVLGPLTMVRSAVLLAGAAAAAWTAPGAVQVVAFATVAVVLLAEAFLHRWATTIPPAGLPATAAS